MTIQEIGAVFPFTPLTIADQGTYTVIGAFRFNSGTTNVTFSAEGNLVLRTSPVFGAAAGRIAFVNYTNATVVFDAQTNALTYAHTITNTVDGSGIFEFRTNTSNDITTSNNIIDTGRGLNKAIFKNTGNVNIQKNFIAKTLEFETDATATFGANVQTITASGGIKTLALLLKAVTYTLILLI